MHEVCTCLDHPRWLYVCNPGYVGLGSQEVPHSLAARRGSYTEGREEDALKSDPDPT